MIKHHIILYLVYLIIAHPLWTVVYYKLFLWQLTIKALPLKQTTCPTPASCALSTITQKKF